MARRLFCALLALLSFCTPLLVSTAAVADMPGWSFTTTPYASSGSNQFVSITPGATGSFVVWFRCRESSGAPVPWFSDSTSFTAGTAKSVLFPGCANDVAGRRSVAFAVTTAAGAAPTWETAALTWTDPAYPALGLSAPPTSTPSPTPTPTASPTSPPATAAPSCGLTEATACWTRPVPVTTTPAPAATTPTLVELASGDRLVQTTGAALSILLLAAMLVAHLRRP